jgi:hypothetical protein
LKEKVVNIFLKNDDNLRVEDDPYLNIINTVAKPDYEIITRIIIDNLFIKLHDKNKSPVEISSDSAVINVDLRNIEFKGNFSIVDANNKKIIAHEAVWTYKSNLIYFPRGCTLHSLRYRQQASFFIDASGNLKQTRNPVNEKFRKDRIEEMEKILVTKYIAPYFNSFYVSLLTNGKLDSSIFKKRKDIAVENKRNAQGNLLYDRQ